MRLVLLAGRQGLEHPHLVQLDAQDIRRIDAVHACRLRPVQLERCLWTSHAEKPGRELVKSADPLHSSGLTSHLTLQDRGLTIPEKSFAPSVAALCENMTFANFATASAMSIREIRERVISEDELQR